MFFEQWLRIHVILVSIFASVVDWSDAVEREENPQGFLRGASHGDKIQRFFKMQAFVRDIVLKLKVPVPVDAADYVRNGSEIYKVFLSDVKASLRKEYKNFQHEFLNLLAMFLNVIGHDKVMFGYT